MKGSQALAIFFEEPDQDRWLPLDRYPRRLVRRVVRGRPRIGGQRRVFLNLAAGLKRAGIPFRTNDFRFAARNKGHPIGVLGKQHLAHREWHNPVIIGPCAYSHPLDDPNLFDRLDVRAALVPGEWCRAMFAEHWGERVKSWPVGIDTDLWKPREVPRNSNEVLIYDKILWDRERVASNLLRPLRVALNHAGLRVAELRYGAYREEEFHDALVTASCMIFLCEHETQGLAYLQALSSGVPILAWDRGGYWQDPYYFPDRVRFGPVTSVPYWDERCGMKFSGPKDLPDKFQEFWQRCQAGEFSPRDYVAEHLTLPKAAERYADIIREYG